MPKFSEQFGKSDMLSARNVIIVTVAIAAISVIGSVAALLQPDHGGEGRDSFGTRSHGYRAFVETLQDLQVPVRRVLVPPTEVLDGEPVTLIFWEPHLQLVVTEPVHLQKVAEWVRRGGKVVVSPSANKLQNALAAAQAGGMSEETTILVELGLEDVGVAPVDLSISLDVSETDESEGAESNDGDAGGEELRGDDPIPADASLDDVETDRVEEMLDYFLSPEPLVLRRTDLQAEGSLESVGAAAKTLVVPENDLLVLEMSESEPTGRVTVRSDADEDVVVAASFSLGDGEVVVVADPRLLNNSQIAQGDNVILMSHLMFDPERTIVFDEFYHGLTIRGNPLWLMTKPSFALLGVVLLAVVGLFVWRDAVFLGPPQSSAGFRRRSLAEYVEAMARFFQKARGSRRFVLQEVRDGALWSLRHRLHLHPGQENLDEVAIALARKDPVRAQQLREAVATIDDRLAPGAPCTKKQTLRNLQRITDCL